MDELDTKIAELERELARLRRLRKPDHWELQKSFTIDAADTGALEDQLTLDSAPELVHLILDALYVSVFLKYSDVADNLGRRFTYINKTARERLGWSREDVRNHYDSEAFPGQFEAELYRKMLKQETETLAQGKSRQTSLAWEWKPEAWRRSRTKEIPIFVRDQDSKPVAFCAIAEELEFEVFSVLNAWLRHTFKHEYGGVLTSHIPKLERATEWLKLIKTKGILDNSAVTLFQERVDDIVYELDYACKSFELYGTAVLEIFKAFGLQESKTILSVRQICERLSELFARAPYQVIIDSEPNAGYLMIKEASAVTGVLVALIGNARKHTDREVSRTAPVKVSVAVDRSLVHWRVSNRCVHPSGELNVRTFDPKHDRLDERLTGIIIGQILSTAFPEKEPREMVDFEHDNDGWVTVILSVPSDSGGIA